MRGSRRNEVIQQTTAPYVPPRIVRISTDPPRNHCSVPQVMRRFLGQSLAQFADANGQYTAFESLLREEIIPSVSQDAVNAMRTPYDWCRRRYFEDGPGGDGLVLPNRAIAAVNVVFIRILPSLPWFRFSRFRNVDGSEFDRAGFIEPPNTPAFQAPYSLEANGTNITQYTGIEDADILVDTDARTIFIPPRALLLTANAAVPFSSYSFIPGRRNVEIHYTFGYAPTTYESGAALVFNENSGAVIDPNPNAPQGIVDPVDYSSGMPRGLTGVVADLVVNNVLRRKWRGVSDGLSSITQDGLSESYGSKPYGGDLESEEKALLDKLEPYGITMV